MPLWSVRARQHRARAITIRPYQPEVPYQRATRHPWPCFLFLLPLLVAYEAGVVWAGGAHADALRNGADTWLRWGLDVFGIHQLYAGPVLIATIFLAWSAARRDDCPDDLLGVCLGMAIESVAFGLGLWALSRGLGPAIGALTAAVSRDGGVPQVVTFVGAGIYEELLFRLGLYSLIVVSLRLLQSPKVLAVPVAAVTSATLFAGAHHLGPYGEPFGEAVFLFRWLAGLYFAGLFQFRGFGIAVGAHACYDVLVGG